MSLLEADVNYKVVKDFTAKIQEKAIGTDVLKGINPSQQFIKIVNDELVELLGGTNARLTKGVRNPTVLMLAGLRSWVLDAAGLYGGSVLYFRHGNGRKRIDGRVFCAGGGYADFLLLVSG